MADDQDQSQKTEEPTQKKLSDARKKGDIAKSQDVPVWFVLVAGAALIAAAGPIAGGIGHPLHMLLDHPHQFELQNGGAQRLMSSILMSIAPWMLLIFGMIMVSVIIGHLVQSMPLWTAEKMKPKLDKLSPIKGLTRMFGPQGFMNLFKAILKLLAASFAVAIVLWPARQELLKSGEMDIAMLPVLLQQKAAQLFMASLVVVGMIAALDMIWQKHSFMKRMRMSREDIKQETKQTEGDPMIRARLRALRQERSRKRMLQSVPDATVVITNPTHYSIALKYDPETNPAPIVVAMGVDHLALRIRETARDNDVPIVENPPLARAIYATADIDAVIPREHFEAVAKVIGFVMRTAENKKR
ncbi:MAG: flagellar biosynthesis protein FlhB [Hirschia sp.]|nr:flagellar biosynthesis protein FlhB [Hirschia sp.]MBF17014.1 flagellar biosynthesis protein FlhB [Hirschia sp.]